MSKDYLQSQMRNLSHSAYYRRNWNISCCQDALLKWVAWRLHNSIKWVPSEFIHKLEICEQKGALKLIPPDWTFPWEASRPWSHGHCGFRSRWGIFTNWPVPPPWSKGAGDGTNCLSFLSWQHVLHSLLIVALRHDTIKAIYVLQCPCAWFGVWSLFMSVLKLKALILEVYVTTFLKLLV